MIKNSSVWALAPLALLGPALTCGVPRVMAPLYLLCAVAAIALSGRKPKADMGLLAIFGTLIAYGAVSYIWSISPDTTVSKVFELGGIMAVTAFLWPVVREFSPAQRERLGVFVIAGFLLGLFVYHLENYTNFYFYDALRGGHSHDSIDNKQNKAAILTALWGMMSSGFILFGPYRYKKTAIMLALLFSAFTVTQSKSESGVLIAVLALPMAGVLAFLPPQPGLRLASFCSAALLAVMAPLALYLRHSPLMYDASITRALRNRFEIWDQAARRILEHPIRGWGLDAARHMPNRNEISILYPVPKAIAHLHPHNGPLQVWFEMGLPGMLLVLALILTLHARTEAEGSPLSVRYRAFAMSVLFLVTLSIWGITQGWFVCTLAACGIMAASASSTRMA
jgi:O-antigen ligase